MECQFCPMSLVNSNLSIHIHATFHIGNSNFVCHGAATKTINCQCECHFVIHFHAYKCVSILYLNFKIENTEKERMQHSVQMSISNANYKSHFLLHKMNKSKRIDVPFLLDSAV